MSAPVDTDRMAETRSGSGRSLGSAVTPKAAGAQPSQPLSCSECGKGITRKSKSGKCPMCAHRLIYLASRRDMPGDFLAVAKAKPCREVMRHYNAGRNAVVRWLEQAGLPLPRCRGDAKPMPSNFAEIAPNMTRRQLGRHYHTHDQSIRRWLEQAEITPATYQRPKRDALPAKPVRVINYSGPYAVKASDQRDTSLEGLAAEHLRCATRAIIYRCDDKGRADPKGPLWRYGNVVISPADLFVRAHRHGFEARRFAA